MNHRRSIRESGRPHSPLATSLEYRLETSEKTLEICHDRTVIVCVYAYGKGIRRGKGNLTDQSGPSVTKLRTAALG
jgi:hypothetical protein